MLPHILPDFHLKYPGIEITLVEGSSIDIENKLLKHEVDIGFLHPPIMEPELEWFEFSRDEMVIIPGRTATISAMSIGRTARAPIWTWSSSATSP